MLAIKIFGILLGIFLLFWGFYAAHESKKPFDLIGAICAPLGLILALISTLLICVPNFFSA